MALSSGARVLALSNLFGVATGNEPASVQHGTVSVVTRLDARRGVFETPYHGPVYVLDLVTNNPGAAGGALVTRRGELAAMLGKELRNSLNNTWLNYAVPIDQLRKSVETICAGKIVARAEGEAGAEAGPSHGPGPAGDRAGARRAGADAGLRRRGAPRLARRPPGPPPDDLILLVGNRLIQSCKALRSELELIDRDDRVHLTVLRGQELIEVVLEPSDEETGKP